MQNVFTLHYFHHWAPFPTANTPDLLAVTPPPVSLQGLHVVVSERRPCQRLTRISRRLLFTAAVNGPVVITLCVRARACSF